jgi:signal transduction histidine kinase
VWAVRIAIALMWIGLALIAWDRFRDQERFEAVYLPLAIAVVATMVLSVLPWSRLLRTSLGDAVIVVWLTAMVGLLGVAPDLDMGPPVLGLHLGLAVFAGMMLPRSAAAVVVAGSVGAYVFASLRSEITIGLGDAAGMIGITSLGMLAAIVAEELETRIRRESLTIRDLRREEGVLIQREAELERAYAVLRSIAAGSTLSEVVPEILRRAAESVAARVGMVFAYRPEEQALELLQPSWSALGDTAVDRPSILPLTEHGVAQRVFVEDVRAVVNTLESSADAWGDLVGGYRLHNLIASKLRIEDRDVGVLLLANRITGDFDDRDAEILESLAAPAALVLDHISRYQEARETSERMAELAELKSNFVSVVSHELRTPLTSIIGGLKTALRPEFAHPDPTIRSLLESGAKQADRLNMLIEDLLVISRVDNRAIPVRPEIVDVRDLIRSAVGDVPGSGQLVTVRLAPTLSQVTLDPTHTRRVLINLLANSVKYGEGSPIEIVIRPEAGGLSLTVADHGPGLPFEMRDRAFDSFTQLNRKSVDAKGGVGLGLAISRGLVEAMGGTIRYEPTPGGGATFKIRVPQLKPVSRESSAAVA